MKRNQLAFTYHLVTMLIWPTILYIWSLFSDEAPPDLFGGAALGAILMLQLCIACVIAWTDEILGAFAWSILGWACGSVLTFIVLRFWMGQSDHLLRAYEVILGLSAAIHTTPYILVGMLIWMKDSSNDDQRQAT